MTGTGTGAAGEAGREGGTGHRHPLLGENEDEGRRRDGESVLLKVPLKSQVVVKERRGGVSARGSERRVDVQKVDREGEEEEEEEQEEEEGKEKRGNASDQCLLGRSRRSRRHASKY